MNEWEVQDAARRVYRWAGLSLLLTFALQLLLSFLVSMLSVWMPESLVYPTALCLNTGASAAGALVLARMPERIGKPLAVGLCAASAALFIWFYPVLSGLPVPELWAESLKVLPSFGFY